MRKVILPVTISLIAIGCGQKDESSATNGLADSDNPGAAVSEISAAMGSIGELGAALNLSGIASDYCDEHGTPKKDSTLTNDAEDYGPGVGYCQATHNAQSPDNTRGAMYLAGGIACSMGKEFFAELASPGDTYTASKTVSFTSPCWGSDAEAAAFVADMDGTDSLSIGEVTGERLAADAAYEYKVSFTLPGSDSASTIYLRSKGGIRAASFDGWAVKLDASDLSKAQVRYESATTPNDGGMTRTRLLIDGSLNKSGSFAAITKIQGFVVVGVVALARQPSTH